MKKQRINYLSLANVLSAFAVVMLHTNGVFWSFSTERYWVTANIIESVMYFAVPIFFMISGATLIDYREKYTTKEYMSKRMKKALVPFLAWSVIGVIYIRVHKLGVFLPQSLGEIKEIISSILNVQVIDIYWFFIPLFGVYLCIPLFAAVCKEQRIKVFQYLIAGAFIFNILIPFLVKVFQVGYTNRISIATSSGYLFFVLVGYVLSRVRLEKKWRMVIYLAGMIGLLMHIIGTYQLSMLAGAIDQTYKGYNNLPCVLYSIAIFVLLREVGEHINSEKVWRFINWVAKYTFAIYLLHWFVMDLLKDIFAINIYSIWYRVGAPFFICAICIFITWILRKIPFIKMIVP